MSFDLSNIHDAENRNPFEIPQHDLGIINSMMVNKTYHLALKMKSPQSNENYHAG